MTPRKKLTDIIRGDGQERLSRAWNETDAAEDFAPLPPGEYVARILSGELGTARTTGTPSYKLSFVVLEGEHTDRRFWHDVWLTEPAMPMAKRDLGKLGVKSLEQLDSPLPPGIRCKCKLALRRDDDGNEYNRLRSFEVVGIDAPEPDEFAPADNTEQENAGDANAQADAATTDDDKAASFDPDQFGGDDDATGDGDQVASDHQPAMLTSRMLRQRRTRRSGRSDE